jgi:transposase InsO family protein
VTYAPTDEWVTQQLREATLWEKRPKYLIRDRDKKYGPSFSALLKATGIRDIKTPKRSPRANAVCERFMGSLKRECLDYMLILNCHQAHRLVREYVEYYNQARPLLTLSLTSFSIKKCWPFRLTKFSLSFPTLAWLLFYPKRPSNW